MKERKSNLTKIKLTAAALSLIGAGALTFNLCSEAAVAAELNQTQAVPTTYNVSPDTKKELPEGYQKADYTVVKDPLCDTSPTSKDLTQEEAAELGAQLLWEIYDLDLTGATIYMYYSPGTVTFPRAFWSADVLFSEERKPDSTRYTFSVDSVTGEIFDVCYGRTISAKVDLGLDAALARDCSAYKDQARELAGKFNLVHGDIQSVEYNCQGYSGNDPTLSVDVTGTNGEMANLTFSRYDQQLLGIIYPTSYRITTETHLAEPDGPVDKAGTADADAAGTLQAY